MTPTVTFWPNWATTANHQVKLVKLLDELIVADRFPVLTKTFKWVSYKWYFKGTKEKPQGVHEFVFSTHDTVEPETLQDIIRELGKRNLHSWKILHGPVFRKDLVLEIDSYRIDDPLKELQSIVNHISKL